MLDHLQRKRRWSWLKVVGARINYWQWLTLETGPVSFCLFLFIPFITIICVSRWYFRWWYSWWLVNDDRLWSIKQKTRKTSNETKAKEISRRIVKIQSVVSNDFCWTKINLKNIYLFLIWFGHIIWLGWIPRIFRSFFCAKIFYFWPIHMKAHIEKCKTMLKFFRLFLNIHDFFDFFEVFRIKLFCPVSSSHVLTIIRFPVKFYIGL